MMNEEDILKEREQLLDSINRENLNKDPYLYLRCFDWREISERINCGFDEFFNSIKYVRFKRSYPFFIRNVRRIFYPCFIVKFNDYYSLLFTLKFSIRAHSLLIDAIKKEVNSFAINTKEKILYIPISEDLWDKNFLKFLDFFSRKKPKRILRKIFKSCESI